MYKGSDAKNGGKENNKPKNKASLDCWAAVDKIVTSATKLMGKGATPGFCSQNIQERLHAQHVAMDFTGSGGRIISDPKEAAAIAQSGPRLRHNVSRRQSSLASLGTPLSSSTSSISQIQAEWFMPKVTREQSNLALFSHRAEEGVFLIRACSRDHGGFVLSFTTGGKIVHAQIIPVGFGSAGAVIYSLDGGKTKFPTLEQLVEFHKNNAGPLPTLLSTTQPPLIFTSSAPSTPHPPLTATSSFPNDILGSPKPNFSPQSSPSHKFSPRRDRPLTRPNTAPSILINLESNNNSSDINRYKHIIKTISEEASEESDSGEPQKKGMDDVDSEGESTRISFENLS